MNVLAAIGGAVVFLVAYGAIEWFATVTAPVVGPLFLAALIITPIVLLVKLAKVVK